MTPLPANSPRLTSGSPKEASAEATTTSQPSSSSKPAATALALAAPITGTSTCPDTNRMYPSMVPSAAVVSPSAKVRRSIPEQKERSPVPVTSSTRISGSASASTTAVPIPPIIDQLRALRTSGRLSRRIEHGPAPLLHQLGRRVAHPW